MTSDEFEQLVLDRLSEAEQRLGSYEFRGLRSLIEEHGAVAVAKELVNPSNTFRMHDGFSVLAERDLERFSVEQAMVEAAEGDLFTPAEIAAAKAKLYLASAQRVKRNKLKQS